MKSTTFLAVLLAAITTSCLPQLHLPPPASSPYPPIPLNSISHSAPHIPSFSHSAAPLKPPYSISHPVPPVPTFSDPPTPKGAVDVELAGVEVEVEEAAKPPAPPTGAGVPSFSLSHSAPKGPPIQSLSFSHHGHVPSFSFSFSFSAPHKPTFSKCSMKRSKKQEAASSDDPKAGGLIVELVH